MSMWLRQSTASQEVLLGRFVDSTDGDTEETALTIANTDIKLWKEGATTLANKNSGGATHIANGMYYAVLDATDTDTLGKLEVNVHVSGALSVRREFMVLPAMIYDSLVLGTDRFDVNVTHAADTAWGSGAITAASVATGAIDADALAADAGTEIGTAVWATAARTLTALDEDSTTLDIDTTVRQALGLTDNNLDTRLSVLEDAAFLIRTTIATLASQTSFTLTDGSTDNDAYNGCLIVIEDASTATQKAVGVISDYTGSTKTVTLLTDPAVFTMATSDIVTILADRSLKPTVDNRTLDVTAAGAAGIDWGNVENPTTTVGLSGTTVKTATDVETDTADIQSRLPAALVSGRIDASVGAYQTGMTPLQPTTAGRTLDVTAGGCAGIDWANVEAPTTTLALTGTTIATTQQVDVNTIKTQTVTCSAGVTVGAFVGQATAAIGVNASGHVSRVTLADTVTTLTGHTPQTGDSYARIGAAGAGLTDLGGMSTTMKGQVQTEAEDALVTHRLDELLNADSDIDGAAPPTVGSVFHELMSKTTGSFTFDQTTDSLEAVRDRGDAAWITATGFSTHSAADIWSAGTRTLTSLSGLTVDTVTTLTNLPAITSNWLTAAGLAADAVAEIADGVWDEALSGHATAGSAGAGLSAASAPTAAQVADAVWDELLSGHAVSGSAGAALSAAGTAGDPWITTLPGAYGAGTAGYLIGSYVNASLSAIAANVAAILADTGTDGVVVTGTVAANVTKVNGTTIGGAGTRADPWGPA